MRTRWRRCAAVILITGSISSISGAEEIFGECEAAPPQTAAEALAGLEVDPARAVAYREEVHHPALPEPERAAGVMRVDGDGRLIKEQARPRVEISAIGERFLSVQTGAEGEPSLWPIPDEARPMLDALRTVMSGRIEALGAAFAPALTASEPLWRVRLDVHGDPGRLPVILIGCGPRLRGIEIHEPGGIRRLIVFGELL